MGFGVSSEMLRSIVLYSSSPTFSVAAVHTSTILLWRSPAVMMPCWNCPSIFATSAADFAITSSFTAGRIMSFRPIDAPETVT